MITPLLEKAIAQNKASYSKYTHAFGMFGNLPIAAGKTVIITDIKWNQFVNSIDQDPATVDFRTFFKYNEYQLKIDGQKSVNYMTYRNEVSFTKTTNDVVGDFHMNSHVGSYASYINIELGPPIIQDVFFICEGFIKITISRNAFAETFTSTMGALSNVANEQLPPNGVKGLSVLKRLRMTSLTPNTMFLTPPGNIDAGLTSPGDRNAVNYRQDIDVPASSIYPPDTGINLVLNTPYKTQPLVEFGIVTVDTNHFDLLKNS